MGAIFENRYHIKHFAESKGWFETLYIEENSGNKDGPEVYNVVRQGNTEAWMRVNDVDIEKARQNTLFTWLKLEDFQKFTVDRIERD